MTACTRITHHFGVPVIGWVGFSGAGKTTLLLGILKALGERGLKAGLIKHAHHEVELDQPGKDSFELRKAGANPVLLTTARRRFLMQERAQPQDPILLEELAFLNPAGLDLILVEGFKTAAYPKIEVHRAARGGPYLFPEDPDVFALATDRAPALPHAPEVLDLNAPWEVASFLIQRFCTDGQGR